MSHEAHLHKQRGEALSGLLFLFYVMSWIIFSLLSFFAAISTDNGVLIPSSPTAVHLMANSFGVYWLILVFVSPLHLMIVSLRDRGKKRIWLIIISILFVSTPYGYRYYLAEKYGMHGCADYHPKPSLLLPHEGNLFCDPSSNPE